MKFTTATFVACAAIFATQQADAKIARGVLTPAPGVKGPGGDGMILVRGGRGWRSVHPITGRTCFPGPDDGPICLCGKGEICTQERYIGCATGKCESVQQRRLRRPPHYHMKHEEEYREVASKCDTQYKKNSINWAECINAGFREISGYPAEDDEEFAGSNELGCYLFPQAQVCRQRRLQRSTNNDDEMDDEFTDHYKLPHEHHDPQGWPGHDEMEDDVYDEEAGQRWPGRPGPMPGQGPSWPGNPNPPIGQFRL